MNTTNKLDKNFYAGQGALTNPFVTGAIAGKIEAATMYGFNTVKNCSMTNTAFPSSIQGFYKGFVGNAICSTLFYSVVCGVNHKLRDTGHTYLKHDKFKDFHCALFAALAATAILNPIEVITIDNMMNRERHLWTTMRRLKRDHGFRSFYKGFGWGLARNTPTSVVVNVAGTMGVERMNSFLHSKDIHYPVLSTSLGVGIPAFLTATFTHVIDHAKTKVQSGQSWKECLKKPFAGFVGRSIRMTFGPVIVVATFAYLQEARNQHHKLEERI